SDLLVEAQVVEEVKDKTIDIYPNPASSYFVVFSHTATAGSAIAVTDLNGRIIKRALLTANATRIVTSDIANGLYIVRITDAKGKTVRTEKIIIQK
ncbi:MAG TPA: T9SS type A sorting domain-containing protein, partial [Flavisolibacter sp.]